MTEQFDCGFKLLIETTFLGVDSDDEGVDESNFLQGHYHFRHMHSIASLGVTETWRVNEDHWSFYLIASNEMSNKTLNLRSFGFCTS